MRARMVERLALTPDQYRKLTYVALAALTFIVFTGAAVRLTDSGLGCPTWPKCRGEVYPPVGIHSFIEFGNRALSGFVGLVTGAVVILTYTRRPFRRDLVWWAWTLPLGVVAQAVLGGFTVREKLAPGFVMSHFLLSMILLIGAFGLAWRATHEPGWRPRTSDRALVWSVRGVSVLAAITIFAGTAATAAGPHSGGFVGQHIKRLTIKGPRTLEWAVNQHGTAGALLGIAVIATWLLKRKRMQGVPLDPLEPLTILGVLIAAQGLVGAVQYELKLPGEMVWVHVCLATVTWVVTLWAVVVEGRLAKRKSPADPDPNLDADGELGTIVETWSQSIPASTPR
jgi:cytochrome c oxidase assembly protein subunit 15